MVESGKVTYAICMLKEDGNSGVNGVVKMLQKDGADIEISGTITGLTPGLHGFHIHEFGNLTNGCVTAGAHYNPHGKTHAGPTDEVRHVGDLGTVTADESGKAEFSITDKLIKIAGNENNVIGRSYVVHEKPDDLGRGGDDESLKTGNAGKRLACGVIGLSGAF